VRSRGQYHLGERGGRSGQAAFLAQTLHCHAPSRAYRIEGHVSLGVSHMLCTWAAAPGLAVRRQPLRTAGTVGH
jgi:hypothetical protein